MNRAALQIVATARPTSCEDGRGVPLRRPRRYLGQSDALICLLHSLGGISGATGGISAGATCISVAAGGVCAAAARGLVVAAAFQAAALRFIVFAAFAPLAFSFRVLVVFLPTTRNFCVRAAFFAGDLPFLGIRIPLLTGDVGRRSYNA